MLSIIVLRQKFHCKTVRSHYLWLFADLYKHDFQVLFICLPFSFAISFIIMSLYTQNVGDVSPTNLSPDGSPATSCDEGETRRSVYTELYWITCSMMLTIMLTRIKSHVDDRVACYIFSIRIGFLYFQISVNLLGTYLANLICFKVTKKIKQFKWV